MAKQENKKKSPKALLIIAFAAILIVMLIANYRSVIVDEVRNPESGVDKLLTYGKQLIAISPNKDIYAWEWEDFIKAPQTSRVEAQMVTAMSNGYFVWVPDSADDVLVVGNLKGSKQLSRQSLGMDKKCELLQASQNGEYAVAVVLVEGLGKQIQFITIIPEPTKINPSERMTIKEDLKLTNVAISNDGTLIAAVGGNDKGYLLVTGANGRELFWEHYVEDCSKLKHVVISPDCRTIYAASSKRQAYIFDGQDKKLFKKLEIEEYKTSAKNPQTITCMALSSDSRLLAAVSSPNPRAYIWDAKTGDKIGIMKIGNFPISGIAFSPDSSMFAEAIAANRSIRIWKVPNIP